MKITYRGIDDSDRARLAQWVAKDGWHIPADIDVFTKAEPGRETFAVEEDGKVVYYCCIQNVARVWIQFNPDQGRVKNSKALILGFGWLMKQLKTRGYHELIFNSVSPKLIRFVQKTFGFIKRDQDYSVKV